MKIYQAKSFKNRKQLEDQIVKDFGLTPEKKDVKISGKIDDLKKVHLSGNSVVWGVFCEEVGAKERPIPESRPERGKKFTHGINIKNNSTINNVR